MTRSTWKSTPSRAALQSARAILQELLLCPCFLIPRHALRDDLIRFEDSRSASASPGFNFLGCSYFLRMLRQIFHTPSFPLSLPIPDGKAEGHGRYRLGRFKAEELRALVEEYPSSRVGGARTFNDEAGRVGSL